MNINVLNFFKYFLIFIFFSEGKKLQNKSFYTYVNPIYLKKKNDLIEKNKNYVHIEDLEKETNSNIEKKIDINILNNEIKENLILNKNNKNENNDKKIIKESYLRKLLNNNETIYAVSSGYSNINSAIGVIRISGQLSKMILEILLHNEKKEKKKEYLLDDIINLRKNIEPRKIYLGNIYDLENNIIDKILYVYYKEPKSYTGETVIEIFCHGNPFIEKEIMVCIFNLNEIFDNILRKEKDKFINKCNNEHIDVNEEIIEELKLFKGFDKIRQSFKGEFTRRAYENQKMNILEIEGLKELLYCRQKIQKNIALNYLDGKVKNIYLELEKKLKNLLMYSQFKIDFEEEHTLDEDKKNVDNNFIQNLNEIIKQIKNILKKDNVEDLSISKNVLLFGNVNSGKSTLMNSICKNDISIVTKIKGSTIDIIQKNVEIDKNIYNFCDSAGIINNYLYSDKKFKNQNEHKKLEYKGIKKTIKYLKGCFACFLVLNINKYSNELKNIITILNNTFKLKKKKRNNKTNIIPFFFVCVNKCDLKKKKVYIKIKENIKNIINENLKVHLLKKIKKIFFISAKKSYNVKKLLKYFNQYMIKLNIKKDITKKTSENDIYFLPFKRHKPYLKKTLNHLLFAKKNYNFITFDIICEEIILSINSMRHIFGHFQNEQILNQIFEHFCIGK